MTECLTFFRAEKDARTFRAGWILKDPHTLIRNGYIDTEGGKIRRVYTGRTDSAGVTDCGPGLLMPALVNAHLHLELSALKNRVPMDQGFPAWVAALIMERDAVGPDALARAAAIASAGLRSHGTGLVGEISTLGITRETVTDQDLAGVWFRELLGNQDPGADLDKKARLWTSLAGHAPHTTDPGLLKQIKSKTRASGLPFSIHLAESEAEMAFINGTNPEWEGFLASRGIDSRAWPVGGTTPVRYLHRLGLLDPLTLGVHLIHTSGPDLEILARTGTRICVCPRSNENLHDRLPDIRAMLDAGLFPALGTDSLASCSSLSLFDEMAFVRNRYPDIDPESVLAMATVNGADALGLGRCYGTIDAGKMSDLIYVDVPAGAATDVIERVTTHEFT